MKILVADKIAASGVEYLREQEGFEVVEAYGSSPEQILELVKDVDAIAVRSETKITAEVFAAAPKLKAVGRAGVGVDNIDVDAATSRGVVVMNTPTGNTIATAELTFTHMLLAARPVSQASQSMREGRWDRKVFSGSELNGKVLGVCGLGRIGAEVTKRAQAFGMTVLAYDPYLTVDRANALEVEPVDLDTLFAKADYITVHMPLTDATENMINAAAFEKMKKGVCIINCARGGIVNEDDLVEAVKSGKVGGAGLDVYENEPLAKDHPLRSLPNVVLTPHLGASTKEAQESVGFEVAEALTLVLQGGTIRNAVNMPSVDSRTLKILRPYLNLGERLGTIVQQIAPQQVTKLRITYWGNIVDLDANPLTRSIQKGYLRKISGKDVNDVNAPHVLKRLGIEVEIVKSNSESDYTELVQVEAITAQGQSTSLAGTLIGTQQKPRLVNIKGRELEATPNGFLLLLENKDIPGIVGMLGTILGKDGTNIANMSLSRNAVGGIALTALELDSRPSSEALKEIEKHEAIASVALVEV